MKTPVTIAILLSLAVSPQVSAASAADTVQATTAAVISRLVAEQSAIEASPCRVYEIAHDLIVPHFDFATMSAWALHPYWEDFTLDEQERFAAAYEHALVYRYAAVLQSYTQATISYVPAKSVGPYTIVTQQVERPNRRPLLIEYRMRQSGADWRVVDIVIENVSLVLANRSAYQTLIGGGIDKVIAYLERSDRSAECGAE